MGAGFILLGIGGLNEAERFKILPQIDFFLPIEVVPLSLQRQSVSAGHFRAFQVLPVPHGATLVPQ